MSIHPQHDVRLRAAINAASPTPHEALTDQLRLIEDLGWDECEVFLIVDLIADEFGIAIDVDE